MISSPAVVVVKAFLQKSVRGVSSIQAKIANQLQSSSEELKNDKWKRKSDREREKNDKTLATMGRKSEAKGNKGKEDQTTHFVRVSIHRTE